MGLISRVSSRTYRNCKKKIRKMLALRLQPALRATMAYRTYSINDATYHRDPATGKAYTEQGYHVCINDDDVKKYWPKVYERRQIHAKAHADHVPMHLARFPQATQGFVYFAFALFVFNVFQAYGAMWRGDLN